MERDREEMITELLGIMESEKYSSDLALFDKLIDWHEREQSKEIERQKAINFKLSTLVMDISKLKKEREELRAALNTKIYKEGA